MSWRFTRVLIEAGGQRTLVDAGLAIACAPTGTTAIGRLTPSECGRDIGQVILTHTGDHADGATPRGGGWVPTFREAEYVVQDREVAAMRDRDDAFWARGSSLVDHGRCASSTAMGRWTAMWRTA